MELELIKLELEIKTIKHILIFLFTINLMITITSIILIFI